VRSQAFANTAEEGSGEDPVNVRQAPLGLCPDRAEQVRPAKLEARQELIVEFDDGHIADRLEVDGDRVQRRAGGGRAQRRPWPDVTNGQLAAARSAQVGASDAFEQDAHARLGRALEDGRATLELEQHGGIKQLVESGVLEIAKE